MLSRGVAAPSTTATSRPPCVQCVVATPLAATNTLAPTSASWAAHDRPASPAPMTTTSARGTVELRRGRRSVCQHVHRQRAAEDAGSEPQLGQLVAPGDRPCAAEPLSHEPSQRRVGGTGTSRVEGRRRARYAEGSLAWTHTEPGRASQVVQGRVAAFVERVLEAAAGHDLAFAHELRVATACGLVGGQLVTEPVRRPL